MALENIDSSSTLLAYLRTATKASDVRDLVYEGATNILEAGDITPTILASLEDSRRTDDELDKALAIAVQDAGDDPYTVKGMNVEFVIVRIYDRSRGNRNLRAVRLALQKLFRANTQLPFKTGIGSGMLKLQYDGRAGHLYDTRFSVDFEALTYRSIVASDRS